jgi:hypothetical protein
MDATLWIGIGIGAILSFVASVAANISGLLSVAYSLHRLAKLASRIDKFGEYEAKIHENWQIKAPPAASLSDESTRS